MDEMLKRALDARVPEILPEPTPLDPALELGERLGVEVYLKREDLTPVHSFKIRGAFNRIARLDESERAAGVIAASAGNHAQGVACSAARLGVPCRIVMPRTTPTIKVDAVRRHDADIELVGDDYSAAAARAAEIAASTGMTMVPPFDDLDVIAGQATVGLEILRQAPRSLAAIFVPVGGGGLAGGVAAVVKELRPAVRVIGVQSDDSDAMRRSLAAGERVALPHVGIFADGVAVRQVGEHTFALCRRYLDDCITVSTDEICAAIKAGYQDTRVVLEPAGALGIAGLKRWRAADGASVDGAVVAIASGANISFTRLRYVTERAEVGEHREAILAVSIPERPGAFLEFCSALGDRSVTEFNYRLASRDEAHVFVGVEIERSEVAALVEALTARGYGCVVLTEDDLAKTHIRHMVGGRAQAAADEVLFTFEFPERPGALREFLASLGDRWNISVFHYRNHGAAFGSVLCGFEVPAAERPQLIERLDRLGFSHRQESDSPAARMFL